MTWKREYLLLLLVLIVQSIAYDIHSIAMSLMANSKPECASTTCLPFANIVVSDIPECQIHCLAQVQCKACSFRQSTSNCKLFAGISNSNSNMSVDTETITMIVIAETRIPYEGATSSTTTTALASSTSNTISTTTTSSSSTTTTTSSSSTSSTTTSSSTSSSTSSTTTTTTGCSSMFYNQTIYSVGSIPISIVVADVNTDNKADIVVANRNANNIGVLLNSGSATFLSQTTYSVGQSPYSLAIADLNSDNKLDIIAANYNGNTVSVLLHC